MSNEKINLEGLEYCPTCGHKLKINVSEKAIEARKANGKKGGRPINPNSKRQLALKAKEAKTNQRRKNKNSCPSSFRNGES